MSDERRRFGERPLADTFPMVASHDPWKCPVCDLLMAAHRFAKTGPRRGYLWRLTASGDPAVCIPSVIVDSPPRRPPPA